MTPIQNVLTRRNIMERHFPKNSILYEMHVLCCTRMKAFFYIILYLEKPKILKLGSKRLICPENMPDFKMSSKNRNHFFIHCRQDISQKIYLFICSFEQLMTYCCKNNNGHTLITCIRNFFKKTVNKYRASITLITYSCLLFYK